MDVPRQFQQHQLITSRKTEATNTLPTLMHELIQDVITLHHLGANLKPHSPNMFPTTGIARLNWSLEEWPRPERCE
jgi:23S rRNA maturation-related 3'-5' exoribonuclease YhaM